MDSIENHFLDHFQQLFSKNVVLQDNGLVEETIPNLINEDTNNTLTLMPTNLEIKEDVMSLNKDGVPGSDGF